jgi:propanol-preferring alcohol dehydrogenase
LENLCEGAKFTGFHVDGGYAEFMVVPEDFAFPVPSGLPESSIAPLLCAGVIGYRAFRLSEAEAGGCLGLYGFGASAHIVLQVARHLGCRVFVFTRSPGHKKLARRLGAEWVGEAREDPPVEMDSAIVFAPAGWIVPEALRVLRRGGTVALAGIHMSPIPEMKYERIYGERTLRSVANMTRKDVEELLELATEIPIHPEVTTFSLSEANEALLQIKESKMGGAAVLQIP